MMHSLWYFCELVLNPKKNEECISIIMICLFLFVITFSGKREVRSETSIKTLSDHKFNGVSTLTRSFLRFTSCFLMSKEKLLSDKKNKW